MSDYQLGQRVRVNGTVEKHHSYARTEFLDALPPTTGPYGRERRVTEGVVVGKRTVQPGETHHTWDEPATFMADIGKARPVYLVAYDLHRKPVMCAPEQLAPIQEETR